MKHTHTHNRRHRQQQPATRNIFKQTKKAHAHDNSSKSDDDVRNNINNSKQQEQQKWRPTALADGSIAIAETTLQLEYTGPTTESRQAGTKPDRHALQQKQRLRQQQQEDEHRHEQQQRIRNNRSTTTPGNYAATAATVTNTTHNIQSPLIHDRSRAQMSSTLMINSQTSRCATKEPTCFEKKQA